jgi:alpha-tubulin suppressor-like RCC1 family protein
VTMVTLSGSTAALLPFQGQLMRARPLLVPLIVALSACSDQTYSTAPNIHLPSFTIADALRDYKPGFYWLPPMVKQPNATGEFDASLSPTVDICVLVDDACGDIIATYTMTSGPGGELVRVQDEQQYRVNWYTDQFALSSEQVYRISIRAGDNGVLLGYADVQPVADGSALKRVDREEFIPLVDGRTLPIRFRIETGVVGDVDVTPLAVTLEPGGTQQYTATVSDLHGNPKDVNVTWSSSNESVAIVDQSGLATAIAEGTAIITATAEFVSGSATLTVEGPHATAIAVAPSEATLQLGGTQQYVATVTDQHGNPMSADLVWSSSDESIATVDQSGLATAVTAGTATITASVGTVSGSATLTVEEPVPVLGSIELVPANATLNPGGTQQFVPTILDVNGNPMSADLIWRSLDETVAIVDQSGLVTAVSPGTAIITATSGSVSGSATLTVEPPVVEGVVIVKAGDSHSCAIDENGLAYCWGLGSSGQLGNGVLVNRLTPFPVAGGLTFAAIATAETHSCGITTTGQAYCWGLNNVGQLGDGTTTGQSVPTPVAGTLIFTSIVTGAFHTCALTASGEAYCWGFSNSGALGNGTTAVRTSPTLVSGNHLFTALTAGRAHTCGLTTAGETYCWGLNSAGQLGDGTTSNRLAPAQVIGGLTFVSISAGDAHTCALTASGSAYCWGNADMGRLGMGDPGAFFHTSPQAVLGALAFTMITSGEAHSCGLTSTGEAYCWGSNAGGRLGIGTTDAQSLVPAAVVGGLLFRSIDVGDHSCAVTTTNLVYCWGPGGSGRLGNGTTVNQLAPTAIAPFPES